jgi:hypothetical protein
MLVGRADTADSATQPWIRKVIFGLVKCLFSCLAACVGLKAAKFIFGLVKRLFLWVAAWLGLKTALADVLGQMQKEVAQTQATPSDENKNTEMRMPPVAATSLTQMPPSPIEAIPAPEVRTPPKQTRDSATRPWIRKIDKLSLVPFAAVSAILLCYALSRGDRDYTAHDTFDFWLGTLLWVALPSLVTISSFLNYPKRRIFEVIVSLVFLPVSAYFLLTSYSTSMPPFVKYFFITFARETADHRYNFTVTLLLLPVLGAIMILWLLHCR